MHALQVEQQGGWPKAQRTLVLPHIDCAYRPICIEPRSTCLAALQQTAWQCAVGMVFAHQGLSHWCLWQALSCWCLA